MFFIKPMPRPLPDSLLEQAVGARPATIGHDRFMGFPSPKIVLMANPKRIAGTAVTLALPGFDSTLLHHAIGLLREGDFLLIDRLGDRRHACIGGGVSLALAHAKIAGVIVDGCCTDVDEIKATGLSVWARGTGALTTRPSGVAGSMNVPVSIGGAVAMPGDLVIADESGIVVLPAEEASVAVSRALATQAKEDGLLALLEGGAKVGNLTGATELVEKKLAPNSSLYTEVQA